MEYKRIMLVRPESRCGWGFMWAPLAINLEYIAAFIQNDVEEIKIIDQEFHNEPIAPEIREFKPDFFGVTMSATDHISGLDLCKTAKKYDISTGIGGYHPTAIPDDMIKFPQIDFVFRGESEQTMKEFVKQGSPENINGITYKNNGNVIHNKKRIPIQDLDSMPFPARHLRVGDECDRWLKRGLGHRDQIHTSRGCWGRCTFCCEPSMSLSKQRYRSPENVMKEIKEIYKFHDEENTFILLGDPHFLGKPELCDRFSDLLIKEDLDINFTAMVRADSVAQNPEVVKKMIKAGIIGYCMGLESPALSELKGTKKGISNKTQIKAVRLLRENHAVAGGTFIIGLPSQTEEEIMTFPEYARNLGMLNAAFAIVTPQAGTEFYYELDSKGLIFERDWTKYDQMHSVFKHEQLSKERLEQLLTLLTGRFYALDIFIDDMIEAQFRNKDGRKMTLNGAFSHFRDRVRFVLDAGAQYRPEDGREHGMIFLKAQINPWTRKRTAKIGMHNMIQLEAFLKTFGNQKIQIAILKKGVPFVYYVLKTTKKTVEYLDICETPHKDATLNLELDLHDLRKGRSKVALGIVKKVVKNKEFFTFLRAGLALLVDHLKVTKGGNHTPLMKLPEEYNNTACAMDSWSLEKYQNLKINSQLTGNLQSTKK